MARERARITASMAASAVSAPWPMILDECLILRPFCQATHEAMLIGSPSGELGHEPWQKIRSKASCLSLVEWIKLSASCFLSSP